MNPPVTASHRPPFPFYAREREGEKPGKVDFGMKFTQHFKENKLTILCSFPHSQGECDFFLFRANPARLANSHEWQAAAAGKGGSERERRGWAAAAAALGWEKKGGEESNRWKVSRPSSPRAFCAHPNKAPFPRLVFAKPFAFSVS